MMMKCLLFCFTRRGPYAFLNCSVDVFCLLDTSHCISARFVAVRFRTCFVLNGGTNIMTCYIIGYDLISRRRFMQVV
jgi:hypothetical protein